MTTCRPVLLTAFLAALLLLPVATTGAPVPKGNKEELVKADLAKLEGEWEIVAYQKDGDAEGAAALRLVGEVVTFKDREYTFSSDLGSGAIDDIDPTQSPKRVTYKGKAGKLEYGIYLLEGDVFVDCLSDNEKDRPTAFTSRPDSGHTLIMYRRVRADKDK